MIKRSIVALAVFAGISVVYLAASLFSPALLLFPHERRVGETLVYSETPIPDEIDTVIRRSDALLRTSELFEPRALSRPVFITRGGWRWRLLSFETANAFAQTRPFGESVIVNRADIALDKVWTGAPIAGERSLSGIITHERTHILIRMRFGVLADRMFPAWLREGYCDHVANSSTLSDGQASQLVAENRMIPALFYYQSRKRVERALRDNGGSVQTLFQSSLAPSSPKAPQPFPKP
jgi:hypothetical protein